MDILRIYVIIHNYQLSKILFKYILYKRYLSLLEIIKYHDVNTMYEGTNLPC